jgi:hypothetical protein
VAASRAVIAMALMLGACHPLAPRVISAQAGGPSASDPQEQGLVPDASFEAMFRKYTPPNSIVSPFYSWDARMNLNITILRKGPSALTWGAVFQTVGTGNLGSKVSVGGTGYLLSLGYVHTYSRAFKVSAGMTHLSTHLTRDLDDKLEETRNKSAPLPLVDDPSEYNVAFVKTNVALAAYPFSPELEAVWQPIDFRFNGHPARSVRPVYLATRVTLWRGAGAALRAETQHEIGHNPFNNYWLSFELDPGHQAARRFEFFVSASPGHNLHSSPDVGGLRDGIAFGIRMRFRA